MSRKIVVALGGNAILSSDPSAQAQQEALVETAKHLVKLIKNGDDLIITHGNGPQVGNLLLQHLAANSEKNPAFPLDSLVAMTEGSIGYWLQNALQNALLEEGIEKDVASVVTQVVVDKNDPAFVNLSKPIGPFYSEEEAKAEARILMLGSNNILNLKDGKPIVTPSQDMVLGNYYITMEKAGLEGEGRVFKNPVDAMMAYERREITLQTRIAIKADAFKHKILMDNLKDKYLITTPGKIKFNDILPDSFSYINEPTEENIQGMTPSKYFVDKGENIKEKIAKLNNRIYKAKKIIYTENAEKKLKEFEDIIKNKYVCVAKSPYSFTDNDYESEENTTMTITDISVSNGVGFVVVYTAGVMLMPGLPSSPQAERIDVDKDGNIIGME